MKINSKDFPVDPGKNVDLLKWPTLVKPFCKSKKRYQKLLAEHVEELYELQRLHYLKTTPKREQELKAIRKVLTAESPGESRRG